MVLSNTKQTVRSLLHSPLAQALAWPHGVDRYLELLDPLMAGGEIRARVVAIHRETADCSTLVLKPNSRWQQPLAGQHVQISVELDGIRRTRCFSISSSARRADGCITLTVKAHADGYVSHHLAESAQVGDVINLSPAQGNFVLPAQRPDKLLLISGGSGITPVMSMLTTLVDEQYHGEIIFLHYARSRADMIFGDELQAIAAANPNLRMVPVFTRDDAGELRGHFCAAHAEALPADYADWPAYACGPARLIEAVRSHWQGLDADDRLQVEYFQPPARSTPADGGEVRFEQGARSVTDSGATLLEQAEAAGLTPDYGCRMGICHTCTCRKTAGRVRNVLTGEVSADGEEDIQPCISVPAGNVSLVL